VVSAAALSGDPAWALPQPTRAGVRNAATMVERNDRVNAGRCMSRAMRGVRID
jgi:hypothetical protein